MLKLRTMVPDSREGLPRFCVIETIDRDPSSESKLAHDIRVQSKFARFCRRHSIDELPQLWHVLTGQMSLVGPRPLTRGELVKHYGTQAATVLSVKPGLTGNWQTHGRSLLSMQQRVALDCELVRTLSLGLYCKLLLRTVLVVVRGSGAW
jgi:lipopolysaccharide/colanic/teichoic acid biosynthesis glycosyltransferase